MKRTGAGLLCSCLIWISGISVIGQTGSQITAASVKPHIFKLADDKMEGRGAGYRGEKAAADYIAAEFKRAGLKPAGSKGYFQEFSFHPYHPPKPWSVFTSRNVIGSIEGSDTELKKEVIVIGAHYDGQGRAGQADPTRQYPESKGSDDIWNSANDNATSVAALIEIARAMQSRPVPKRTVLFIAFGAEEHGMTGSIYYVNHPHFPIGQHIAMINLEKLGRQPERPYSISGTTSSNVWTGPIKTIADAAGLKVATAPIAFPDSDHYPFGSRGVPSIILNGNSNLDVHLPSDSADKMDLERVAAAARFTLALVSELSASSARPSFQPSPMLDPGLIAHLITGAEADVKGLPAGDGALKVTGVIEGGAGAKAGLREGDAIISMGDRRFKREEPLAVLQAIFQDMLQGKLGVKFPMKVLRGKETINLTLNLRP